MRSRFHEVAGRYSSRVEYVQKVQAERLVSLGVNAIEDLFCTYAGGIPTPIVFFAS
jgi:hypothetical protein